MKLQVDGDSFLEYMALSIAKALIATSVANCLEKIQHVAVSVDDDSLDDGNIHLRTRCIGVPFSGEPTPLLVCTAIPFYGFEPEEVDGSGLGVTNIPETIEKEVNETLSHPNRFKRSIDE